MITDGTGKKVRTMDLGPNRRSPSRELESARDFGAAPAGRQWRRRTRRRWCPQVEPGRHTAQLGKMVGDAVTPVGKAQSVQVVALPEITSNEVR